MKIQELLNFDLATLEAMSESQLEKELGHYFIVTRPEYQPKKERHVSSPVMDEKKMKANAILAALGMKL